jgi:hypothetical protein
MGAFLRGISPLLKGSVSMATAIMTTTVCEFCYMDHSKRIPAGKGAPCQECGNDTRFLPIDYEICCECGFDHSYEPEEAAKAHAFMQLSRDMEAARPEDEGGEE